jgi:hypothetical protein
VSFLRKNSITEIPCRFTINKYEANIKITLMNIGDEINVSKRTGIFLQLKCFENFHLN